jgi:hypothetical protein
MCATLYPAIILEYIWQLNSSDWVSCKKAKYQPNACKRIPEKQQNYIYHLGFIDY